jgi:hypothetical protein
MVADAAEFPSSQQATKPSVTVFDSSQRARISLDSGCVILSSAVAAAMTWSRSAIPDFGDADTAFLPFLEFGPDSRFPRAAEFHHFRVRGHHVRVA